MNRKIGVARRSGIQGTAGHILYRASQFFGLTWAAQLILQFLLRQGLLSMHVQRGMRAEFLPQTGSGMVEWISDVSKNLGSQLKRSYEQIPQHWCLRSHCACTRCQTRLLENPILAQSASPRAQVPLLFRGFSSPKSKTLSVQISLYWQLSLAEGPFSTDSVSTQVVAW